MSIISSRAHRSCGRLSRLQRPQAVGTQSTFLPTLARPTRSCQASSAASAPRRTSRPGSQLARPSRSRLRYASTATAPPSSTAEIDEDAPASTRVANTVREGFGGLAEPYIAQSATESLLKECACQSDYIVPQAFERKGEIPKNANGEHIGEGTGWWYENLGLTPTFSTWAQVTFLHMYLLIVRMRYFPPKYAPLWMQNMTDHFFYEAEHRMTIFHGIRSSSLRNKNLKELYNQWRGVMGAYDEGLLKGDAVLGTAVWRNVFGARDDADWRHIALVVGFMRRGLRALDRAHDRTIVGGLVKFGNPMSEMVLALRPSEMMKRPFSPEDEQDMRKVLEGDAGKR